MKRIIMLPVVMAVSVCLAACTNSSTEIGRETEAGIYEETEWETNKYYVNDRTESADVDFNPDKNPETDPEQNEITKMYITINGNKLEVSLADNSSVDALTEILRQGDIEYTAHDYGNFEKVGDIGHSLPRNDEQIHTTPGDVILYQGNNICLYYGNNSWSFTKIGRINGYSEAELRSLLGAGSGNVSVKISLN